MMNEQWGLLGIEKVESRRRSRTLEVGAAVRAFNHLAVPGLGGVWFCKPLLWSCLGIQAARRTGRKNIQVANAVEALACWMALNEIKWASEPRVRGRDKLRGKDDLSFENVSKGSFYVSQPFRQQTGEPLLALGLVESKGSRFNSFFLSETGEIFLHEATKNYRPSNKDAEDFLAAWVCGDATPPRNSPPLNNLLSPLVALSDEALQILRNRVDLNAGAGETGGRMRAARLWIDELKENAGRKREIDWKNRPKQLSEAHWTDLRAGARFFVARDEALLLLNGLEGEMASRRSLEISLYEKLDRLEPRIKSLQEAAKDFLDEKHDPTPQKLASAFCRECMEEDRATLFRKLVARDGRVLRLKEDKIVPGPAFDYGAKNIDEADGEEIEKEEDVSQPEAEREPAWPRGISGRIPNLFWFNLDLAGQINEWLVKAED